MTMECRDEEILERDEHDGQRVLAIIIAAKL